VVSVGLFTAWKLGYFDLDKRRQLAAAVVHLKGVPGAEVVYILAFAVAIAMVLPVFIVSLVGGALFGVWKGALLAWIGALAGTVGTHLLARHVARAPMRKVFGEHRLLRVLREHDDVMELLRLRIMPVAPFAVLDYVAGVAGVSLRRLMLATMLGVVPSVVAYTFVGSELIRGLVTQSQASHRGLWIAGAVTVATLLLSLVPGLFRWMRE